MDIYDVFYKKQDEDEGTSMSKYMRNRFPFLGIKRPERNLLQKKFLNQTKNHNKIDWDFIFKTYNMREREFQYLSIDYINCNKDKLVYVDMEKIEKIILMKSWWDTVDAISSIVGYLVEKYPKLKEERVSEWIKSDNIWLKRVSIIFQLKYKEKTDTEFLEKAILYNARTEEFFINKGIGWALREYSKTDPEWVRRFIDDNQLSKLSIREGSKYI